MNTCSKQSVEFENGFECYVYEKEPKVFFSFNHKSSGFRETLDWDEHLIAL